MAIQHPNAPSAVEPTARRHAAAPSALPFYLPYLVPLLTITSFRSSKDWHSLIAPFFVWVIMPLLDVLVGTTHAPLATRLTPSQRKAVESRLAFKLAVYLWILVHLGTLLWAAHTVQHLEPHVSLLKLLGLLWSVGLIAAEGINCSHELLHRRQPLERFLGKVLLVSVSYGHFSIEHARGHHFNVATYDDPATMRFGESFYSFFPRTVFGGFASAWRLEVKRLRREQLPVFSFHNEMILFALGQVSFCLFFAVCIGMRAFMLFVYQSMVAILLLEQINGIEHYGLTRKQLPSGDYERVGPRHSWDAPQRMSNYLLFKLQIHADHHLHVSKRYQSLELTEGSPQLPAGYLCLAPLILVPPLWRAVMDPVLLAHKRRWELQDEAEQSNCVPR